MHELMYLRFQRERHQAMMREAERERLAAAARRVRKKRPDRHRISGLVRELRGLGGRLLKGLRPGGNTG